MLVLLSVLGPLAHKPVYRVLPTPQPGSWHHFSPIPDGFKGRLRWDSAEDLWRWIDTGPYFQVVTLNNGAFKVNRLWL